MKQNTFQCFAIFVGGPVKKSRNAIPPFVVKIRSRRSHLSHFQALPFSLFLHLAPNFICTARAQSTFDNRVVHHDNGDDDDDVDGLDCNDDNYDET